MFFNLLNQLSEKIQTGFSIVLPNAKEIKFGVRYASSPLQIVIHNEKGLKALKSGDELKISEAYIYGDMVSRIAQTGICLAKLPSKTG